MRNFLGASYKICLLLLCLYFMFFSLSTLLLYNRTLYAFSSFFYIIIVQNVFDKPFCHSHGHYRNQILCPHRFFCKACKCGRVGFFRLLLLTLYLERNTKIIWQKKKFTSTSAVGTVLIRQSQKWRSWAGRRMKSSFVVQKCSTDTIHTCTSITYPI